MRMWDSGFSEEQIHSCHRFNWISSKDFCGKGSKGST
ncbi:hypothetical protein ZOSMA_165G00210 [Zostera marina]|uniref:Uncharacterized protein n=1 Tax=Zostera marina TaxID=29655 RepID=A0A0K9PTT6_ZOSMR|nr:hypothetical protein ZOSMA_165G00210 [Zostera marina]